MVGSVAYSAYDMITRRIAEIQVKRSKGIRGWLRKVSHWPEPPVKKHLNLGVLPNVFATIDGNLPLSEAYDYAADSKDLLGQNLAVDCNNAEKCIVESAMRTTLLTHGS